MSQGTTFQAPLRQGGPDTGVSTTNTTVNVPFIKEITVSAGNRDVTFTLPDNAYLNSANAFVVTKVSGIAQGAQFRIGDGTTDTLYGSATNVSAAAVYAATMAVGAVSAKTVVVKVTASVAGSAAALADIQANVVIVGGVRG